MSENNYKTFVSSFIGFGHDFDTGKISTLILVLLLAEIKTGNKSFIIVLEHPEIRIFGWTETSAELSILVVVFMLTEICSFVSVFRKTKNCY